MRWLFALTPLALSACVGDVGPSLAKRPIESRSMAEPAETITLPVAADAELQAQIDGLVNRAEAGQRAFAELLPRARTAAASAGSEGSEGWISAQQLLSALESAREASPSALARLDALVATRLATGDGSGLAEIQAAQERIVALVEAQHRALDDIRARISR